MIQLSLPEFRDYYDVSDFQTIIFSTDNQATTNSLIDLDLKFNQMTILLNPNAIYLVNNRNSMRINQVKSIKIQDECLLGNVFTVVCDDLDNNRRNNEYTLIAR